MRNLRCANEFYLRENKKLFSYQWLRNSTSLWNEGLGPLENGLLHVFDKITRGKKERRGVTVNYLYNGHCRDLGLVSSLGGVRNSGSLPQSNICNSFFLEAPVLIIGMSVIEAAGVRKTRVNCTDYIDCSKILQLQIRIAFAYWESNCMNLIDRSNRRHVVLLHTWWNIIQCSGKPQKVS